ncbi:MAG: family 10 glycosylhydrolase, partial [Pygmaiobacter sp.]
MKHNNRVKSAAVLAGLGLLLLATAVALKGSFGDKTPASSKPESLPVAAVPQSSPAPTVALPREYRAVWISYLEYQQMDFSSEEAFVAEISAMMDNVKAAGCTRVLMQVRACGDALYASEIFPWSHFITGTQGRDPGYDPLAIMLREAHNRGLALEAWVNPYRVRIGASQPELLAPENPAQRYLNSAETEDWVQQVEDGGLWYNPGVPEVRQLIVDGVAELCRNYELDGVQFDDYFYPTTDSAFDETAYATTGKDLLLDDWRRDNVNALVKAVYATVKSINPTMTFGISPQGNSSNNYNMQYSDVALWMKQPGYVDYICP